MKESVRGAAIVLAAICAGCSRDVQDREMVLRYDSPAEYF